MGGGKSESAHTVGGLGRALFSFSDLSVTSAMNARYYFYKEGRFERKREKEKERKGRKRGGKRKKRRDEGEEGREGGRKTEKVAKVMVGVGVGVQASLGATSTPVAWAVAGAASPSQRQVLSVPLAVAGGGPGTSSAGRAGRSEHPDGLPGCGRSGQRQSALRGPAALPGCPGPFPDFSPPPPPNPHPGPARAELRAGPSRRSVACPPPARCSSWGCPAEKQRARGGREEMQKYRLCQFFLKSYFPI